MLRARAEIDASDYRERLDSLHRIASCCAEFSGQDKDEVTDAVVAHAQTLGHGLDRDTVLAHLEGVNPHGREPD